MSLLKHSATQKSCWHGRSYPEALNSAPFVVSRYQVYVWGDLYKDRLSALVENHFAHSKAPDENDNGHMG